MEKSKGVFKVCLYFPAHGTYRWENSQRPAGIRIARMKTRTVDALETVPPIQYYRYTGTVLSLCYLFYYVFFRIAPTYSNNREWTLLTVMRYSNTYVFGPRIFTPPSNVIEDHDCTSSHDDSNAFPLRQIKSVVPFVVSSSPPYVKTMKTVQPPRHHCQHLRQQHTSLVILFRHSHASFKLTIFLLVDKNHLFQTHRLL